MRNGWRAVCPTLQPVSSSPQSLFDNVTGGAAHPPPAGHTQPAEQNPTAGGRRQSLTDEGAHNLHSSSPLLIVRLSLNLLLLPAGCSCPRTTSPPPTRTSTTSSVSATFSIWCWWMKKTGATSNSRRSHYTARTRTHPSSRHSRRSRQCSSHSRRL